MSNNQQRHQQETPVSFGRAHDDPREGLQTDERDAKRESQQRQSDGGKNIGEDEEE